MHVDFNNCISSSSSFFFFFWGGGGGGLGGEAVRDLGRGLIICSSSVSSFVVYCSLSILHGNGISPDQPNEYLQDTKSAPSGSYCLPSRAATDECSLEIGKLF